MPADFSQFAPLISAAFVVYVVYRRLRRNFGRQVLRPGRMKFRIVLLMFLACALCPTALRSAAFLFAALAGAAVGVALALYGAERTHFLKLEDRLYYVPHTYTGATVSLVFLGRLVYRLAQTYADGRAATAHPGADAAQAMALDSMTRSPVSMAIFCVLIGYYVIYYGRVLYKSTHIQTQDIESMQSVVP
jgi:hypothetical protein